MSALNSISLDSDFKSKESISSVITDASQDPVYPAKAGIQRDIHSAKRTKPRLYPTSWALFDNLDTGLRRYDVFFC